MTLQERMGDVFPDEDRGLYAQIARSCGVKPSSVHAWFKNEAKTKQLNLRYARIICTQFAPHINPDWLSDGTPPRLAQRSSPDASAPVSPNDHASQVYARSNVAGLPRFSVAPLVSWVAAGSFCSAADPYQPGDADEWFPVPGKPRPRAFALRVRGPSMEDRGAKHSFSDGDVIIVDPDVAASHHSLVVVRLDDDDTAVFKRLLIDGDNWVLEALNPDWPERYMRIDKRATICGVVVSKIEMI